MKPRSKKIGYLLAGTALAASCAVLVTYGGETPAWLLASGKGAAPEVAEKQAPVRREILDFRMTDLDKGWIRYADGTSSVTEDGGAHWTEQASGLPDAAASGTNRPSASTANVKTLTTVAYQAKEYPVKQAQFVTDRAGWALVSAGTGLANPLLVTTDGGQTWHAEVTPAVKDALQEEKQRQQRISRETALYASPEQAKKAMDSAWTLLPDTASPGDVVLVRHDKPGEVAWQGKTYKLRPFEAGYFTYLPVPMKTKSGSYPIGDQMLKIKDKKFETQQLKVTKKMESMRQDTKRIEADQKKIDAARSKSEPGFLFSGSFIQPIEGRLTTPFGHTRYVNGKFASSHMAIDLAAKEGTPIKAANDGIVALADNFYLSGNTIYIDHGMNLFSQYSHLSKLQVKTGDRVKRGDIIGLVGSTGFSTGPHLHFTFWAHNVPVNPNLFFKTTPFQWLKQKPQSR
ncbi:peptidoglycan DD-metalloendopeptidase family protein [Paenibacillus sp. MZ04-78.2]|uniref:peptidoglycan DD-metalloendopeptidase family protein n=1 Tax=Paenibacillus sp. MZ04-78.2 TaxID=2962034 RepID=UPI00265E8904|nr:peptidoglycan DD-metalloendopeptidase family protein [Paenibacillus sp. MZ04-78.2]